MAGTNWTQDTFSKRLRELAEAGPGSKVPSEVTSKDDFFRRAYREAAAVVSDFDPTTLQPHRVETVDPGSFAVILGDSERVVGGDGTWALRPDIRAQTLRRLVAEEKLDDVVASAEAGGDDPLHAVLREVVAGEMVGLHERSESELSSILELAKLVGPETLDLPPAEEIRRELARSRLLAPMRRVGGDHFYGREAELEQLRNYVGVADPKTVTGKLFRKVRDVLDLKERPPLMIFGPGGMGKSALVSRFILEHSDLEEKHRFPFVYLDFDRPSLAAREPLTLLAEALLQLGAQFPMVEGRCRALRAELREALTWAFKDGGYSDAGLEAVEVVKRSSSYGEREGFAIGLREIFEEIATASQPLLMILDTFEEVQYYSRPDIPGLFDFLEILQLEIPRLRVVLAGRTRETRQRVTPLALEPLSDKDARAMIAGQGVPQAVAKMIVERLGGNPLTLRLAVSVYERDGLTAKDLGDFEGVRRFMTAVDDERAQGELYRRFLEHIPDKAVREMAHPGLILRRLTPDLVLTVLAEPCGLSVTTYEEARDLFERLARHDTLVTWEGNALVHRSDVRRIMIDLLKHSEKDKVDAIHAGAVRHYEPFNDPSSRAEEIYHRYCLEQDEKHIEERWIDGIEDSLRPAINEVPESVRTHLAVRTGGYELSEKDWREAPLAEWERFAIRQARQLIEHARYEDALEMLRQRDKRTVASSIHNLEVIALTRLGYLDEAWQVGTEALRGRWVGGADRLLDLRRSLGSVARRRGEYRAAYWHLLAAAELAAEVGDVQRGADSILLALDSERAGQLTEDPATLRQLATLAKDATTQQIIASPALFSNVAEELDTFAPELVNRLRVLLEEGSGVEHLKTSGGSERGLTADKREGLFVLLTEVFSNERKLEEFLRDRLDVSLRKVSSGGSLSSSFYEVVQSLERRGRTKDLVHALRELDPSDSRLAKLESDLGD